MNKKVMAVAVAGALAVPAMALAQTTIYGTVKAEYGFASQPNNDNGTPGQPRHDAEGLNSGASAIGFKGEEKMGGGLVAWYQCESDLRFLSGTSRTSGSICDRNSAIGLKGEFGNFYIGTWDSPLKRAAGVTRITEDTGWTGSTHMTLTSSVFPQGFSNRNSDSFNYDTPNLGGFSASFQITSLKATLNATATAVAEGRIMGFSGQYATGPVAVVFGYETLDENRAAGGTANSEDTAWLIGASYVLGPGKVGFTYTNLESQVGAVSVERKAWNLAGEYNLPGPGRIRAGIAVADDLEGTVTVANSGAKQWQIGYWHNFSKRTEGYIAYVKVDNDSAGQYNLTGLAAGSFVSATAAGVQPGESASVVAFGLFHKF
jgi:predicted porin